jgi:hypothetical protein
MAEHNRTRRLALVLAAKQGPLNAFRIISISGENAEPVPLYFVEATGKGPGAVTAPRLLIINAQERRGRYLCPCKRKS